MGETDNTCTRCGKPVGPGGYFLLNKTPVGPWQHGDPSDAAYCSEECLGPEVTL